MYRKIINKVNYSKTKPRRDDLRGFKNLFMGSNLFSHVFIKECIVHK